VRPGDSLRRIARSTYGDENLWKAIRDANPGKVGRDGTIAVGAVLAVPFDGL
jgi:nucleoid-associated protein YgaU